MSELGSVGLMGFMGKRLERATGNCSFFYLNRVLGGLMGFVRC